ncbi:MAG: hypothetical protein COV52_01790 [Gammaproteobacteria bacterium CG11_big_fil_rev_8_21_14_0_20_46_22]|nr:MAG: hypothetical protein COW05_05685 [Gammaproteobacteria bacterium CG12_big_fil_rev_8_21_14_0_65_46_12]PIR11846.1 MAG: hypothetical protein COV52_01790 [Gammaproteobacteria bacterium CG11_big_fil_rev_8_21_14_0_20_46_22]
MSTQRQVHNHSLWGASVLTAASARATILDLKRECERQKDINFRLMEREQKLRHWLAQEQENTERMNTFASKFQLQFLETKASLKKEKQRRVKAEGLVKSLREELSKYKADDDLSAQARKGHRLF